MRACKCVSVTAYVCVREIEWNDQTRTRLRPYLKNASSFRKLSQSPLAGSKYTLLVLTAFHPVFYEVLQSVKATQTGVFDSQHPYLRADDLQRQFAYFSIGITIPTC